MDKKALLPSLPAGQEPLQPKEPQHQGALLPPVHSSRPQYCENRERLTQLAGRPCPRCGADIYFDGRRLRCSDGVRCIYSWDNADAAESEILCAECDPS